MKQWINALLRYFHCLYFLVVFYFSLHQNIVSRIFFLAQIDLATERIAHEIQYKSKKLWLQLTKQHAPLQLTTKKHCCCFCSNKIKINRKLHSNHWILWNADRSAASISWFVFFFSCSNVFKLHGEKKRYCNFISNIHFQWVCFVHPKEHDKFLRSLSQNKKKFH